MVFEMDSFTLDAIRKVIVEKDVFNGDADNCDYEIENAQNADSSQATEVKTYGSRNLEFFQ